MKFLLSSLFILGTVLHAGWDAKSFVSEQPLYQLKSLNDPQLHQIENLVFESLQNTWCSREKAQLLMEVIVLTRPQTTVEIGVFRGSSALPLLAACKYLNHGHVYLVDAWSKEEAVKSLEQSDPHALWWSSLDMKNIKDQLLTMLNHWSFNNHCTIIHAPSSLACSQIPSIDFLHIDGNFSIEGSLLDVQLYLPKVKEGGHILISNLSMLIKGKATKTKALQLLFETCETIADVDHSNAILFRKKAI